MTVIFPDFTGGSATNSAPTYHILDTSAGILQFVSGGAGPGTVVFNNNVVYTCPSIAIWQYLQTQVAFAIVQGASQINFANFTNPPVESSYTADPFPIAGGTLTINGFNFQQNCNVYVDYGGGGSGLPTTSLGQSTFVSENQITVTIPAIPANTYAATIINPDGGYCTFALTTA